LLYKFADSQIPYFTHTSVVLGEFELPPITIEDDFYVCFYDRGAVGVAYNSTEPDDNRSYFYNRYTGKLTPARAEVEGSKELVPLNWLIGVVGYGGSGSSSVVVEESTYTDGSPVLLGLDEMKKNG
jgi:hypothetical protein